MKAAGRSVGGQDACTACPGAPFGGRVGGSALRLPTWGPVFCVGGPSAESHPHSGRPTVLPDPTSKRSTQLKRPAAAWDGRSGGCAEGREPPDRFVGFDGEATRSLRDRLLQHVEQVITTFAPRAVMCFAPGWQCYV